MLLGGEVRKVKHSAAKALGHMAEQLVEVDEVIASLITALNDPDPDVREASIEALGCIAQAASEGSSKRRIIEVLYQTLTLEDVKRSSSSFTDEKDTVAVALAGLSVELVNYPEIISALLKKLGRFFTVVEKLEEALSKLCQFIFTEEGILSILAQSNVAAWPSLLVQLAWWYRIAILVTQDTLTIYTEQAIPLVLSIQSGPAGLGSLIIELKKAFVDFARNCQLPDVDKYDAVASSAAPKQNAAASSSQAYPQTITTLPAVSSSSSSSSSSAPLLSNPNLGSAATHLASFSFLPNAAEQLVIKTTKGEGDCAFHAVFGVNTGNRIEDIHVVEQRKRLAQSIRSAKPGDELYTLVKRGIEALVMGNERVKGQHIDALRGAYRRHLVESLALNQDAWAGFQATLHRYNDALCYIQVTPEEASSRSLATFKSKFYFCLNKNEGLLRAVILSIPELEAAFNAYNHVTHQDVGLDDRINTAVMNEYADYLQQSGCWLLPLELGLIAHVFNVTIKLHTRDRSHPSNAGLLLDTYNPGQKQQVAVQFNGVNHYERLSSVSPNSLAFSRLSSPHQDFANNASDSSTQTANTHNPTLHPTGNTPMLTTLTGSDPGQEQKQFASSTAQTMSGLSAASLSSSSSSFACVSSSSSSSAMIPGASDLPSALEVVTDKQKESEPISIGSATSSSSSSSFAIHLSEMKEEHPIIKQVQEKLKTYYQHSDFF